MADKTAEDLLAELGVEIETPKAVARSPQEERIIAGFEDIQRFTEQAGHPPRHGEDWDIFERLYAVRLERLAANPAYVGLLQSSDHQGLLNGASIASDIDGDIDLDALASDLEDLDDLASDITELKHVRPVAEKRAAEEVANRETCADFYKFKPLFEVTYHFTQPQPPVLLLYS